MDAEVQNSYTISTVSLVGGARLTRIFNFEAEQMTTILTDVMQDPIGGSTALSTQMIIQNFKDIESDAELRKIHKYLTEQGGKPPALALRPLPPST